jgi:hypothetical protein
MLPALCSSRDLPQKHKNPQKTQKERKNRPLANKPDEPHRLHPSFLNLRAMRYALCSLLHALCSSRDLPQKHKSSQKTQQAFSR